jgi:hexosaminidase
MMKNRNYDQLTIIPQPLKIELSGGISTFPKTINIFCQSDLNLLVYQFIEQCFEKIQFSFYQVNDNKNASLELRKQENFVTEAYEIVINKEKIVILAASENGFFNALQTLFQVFLFSKNSEIPNLIIFDEPRYSWRGIHLDESRHFFGKDFVKKFIDFISLYKINRFHWHLTDDNGWRIEIKKYPGLHEIASKRINREHLPWKERDFPIFQNENEMYGGFYSQEDVIEILNYAQKRFVTIIPEIEMPGHCRAVFAAYPQFSCTNELTTVASGINLLYRDVYCAGNIKVYDFIHDIIDEISCLFPSKYIHLGGDEVNPYHWYNCPKCQAVMKKNGYQNWQELQYFFMKNATDIVKSFGKIPILWDEILDTGSLDNVIFMVWRGNGEKGLQAALAKKNPVIMCPNDTLYFDWKQDDSPYAKGAFGVTPLTKIYQYEPAHNHTDEEFILGLQGNIWTEFMPNTFQVEYMSVPRLCALAENAWCYSKMKNWSLFSVRLASHINIFQLYDINYYPIDV